MRGAVSRTGLGIQPYPGGAGGVTVAVRVLPRQTRLHVPQEELGEHGWKGTLRRLGRAVQGCSRSNVTGGLTRGHCAAPMKLWLLCTPLLVSIGAKMGPVTMYTASLRLWMFFTNFSNRAQ